MAGLWNRNGEVAELQSFMAEEMKPRFPLDPDHLTAPEALVLTWSCGPWLQHFLNKILFSGYTKSQMSCPKTR